MNGIKLTLIAILFEGLAAALGRLPVRWRLSLVRRAGRLYARMPTGQRRHLERNIDRLFDLSGAAGRALCVDVFENFAVTLHDFFFPGGIVVDMPNRAMVEAARNRYGKLMLLTFHIGHWELGARVMRGWGWPVTAVFQPYRNRRFAAMIERLRAPGVDFIPVGAGAAAEVLAVLRRGGAVAMLGDLPFGEGGTAAEVLGRRVRWPKGPVVLAVREGAPIVMGLVVRVADRRYRVVLEEPILPMNRSRAEVERLVGEVSRKFGKLLDVHRQHWFRFQPLEFLDNGTDAAEEKSSSRDA